MQILKKTFNDYTEEELFISFNGGKDCTVLLHLVISLLNNEKPLHCLYVQPDEPFDEIEEFIKSCEKEYHIKIDKIRGKIKNVLEKVCGENPSLKACIMGSRRTDPYCSNLKDFHVSKMWLSALIVICNDGSYFNYFVILSMNDNFFFFLYSRKLIQDGQN